MSQAEVALLGEAWEFGFTLIMQCGVAAIALSVLLSLIRK